MTFFSSDSDKLLLIWLAFGKLPVVLLMGWFVSLPFSLRRRFVTGLQPPIGQRNREWRGVWLVSTDALLLLLIAAFGGIQLQRPSLENVVASIIAMTVWVDFWMYWTHRWMHRSRPLWAIHRHHHLSRLIEPSTALSFSLGEKMIFYTAGWIGGASVMSWFIPMSLAGITAYYTVYFFLSGLGHCNTVYFRERWIIPSPAVHAMHHWNPSVNFGFYTTLYDRMFGTYSCPGVKLKTEELRE